MANALQLRRGTTTEHGSFTGLAGEITVDTTKDTIVVHDGSTAGGFPLAKESAISTNATTLGGQSLSQIQTAYQAYTDTEVANLVASAPATLDTLNELAAALGDDPNFATTVTNSIATKMPLSGGTFTGGVTVNGTVTADGVSVGDNETIRLGAGDDLQILHDGSNSVIKDVGTGDLQLRGDNLKLANSGGTENYVHCASNGAVQVYYDNSVKLATTSTGVDITGNVVADGCVVDGTLDIEEVFEYVNTFTTTSGTVSFNVVAQGVQFYTANQTANRTINFQNVNSNLAVGQSVTCSVLMTQGSTAYYLNAYQVDGSAVTVRWAGGTAPTAGTASGIDIYTFTIIKTANATFTVLANVDPYS